MNRELVAKTETFLKETFAASEFLQANPSEAAYRLEHSYRVANIAKRIAAEENLSVEDAVVAGLLQVAVDVGKGGIRATIVTAVIFFNPADCHDRRGNFSPCGKISANGNFSRNIPIAVRSVFGGIVTVP